MIAVTDKGFQGETWIIAQKACSSGAEINNFIIDVAIMQGEEYG